MGDHWDVYWRDHLECPRCRSKNTRKFPSFSRQGHLCNDCYRIWDEEVSDTVTPMTNPTITIAEDSPVIPKFHWELPRCHSTNTSPLCPIKERQCHFCNACCEMYYWSEEVPNTVTQVTNPIAENSVIQSAPAQITVPKLDSYGKMGYYNPFYGKYRSSTRPNHGTVHTTAAEPGSTSSTPLLDKDTGERRRYIGVRQRPWGKLAAEIRDPHKDARVYLGTLNTADKAAVAYEWAALKIKVDRATLKFPPLRRSSSFPSSTPSSLNFKFNTHASSDAFIGINHTQGTNHMSPQAPSPGHPPPGSSSSGYNNDLRQQNGPPPQGHTIDMPRDDIPPGEHSQMTLHHTSSDATIGINHILETNHMSHQSPSPGYPPSGSSSSGYNNDLRQQNGSPPQDHVINMPVDEQSQKLENTTSLIIPQVIAAGVSHALARDSYWVQYVVAAAVLVWLITVMFRIWKPDHSSAMIKVGAAITALAVILSLASLLI